MDEHDSEHVLTENVAHFPTTPPEKGMPELPLLLSFEKERFTYTQRWRSAHAAVYSQRHACGSTVYEAIIVQHYPEHVWPDGRVTSAREGYPGATAWGRAGWTFRAQGEAITFLTRRRHHAS